jgi:hypothetical protein
VALQEQYQYEFRRKTWIATVLSLETERYYMTDGECALQLFWSSNGLISSIENGLSGKSLFCFVQNGTLETT